MRRAGAVHGFARMYANLWRIPLRTATAVLILTLSACAHQPPTVQPSVDTVVLPASVPGGAAFCIEELYLSWPTDEAFVRRPSELVCAWTVADVRNWAAKHRNAND